MFFGRIEELESLSRLLAKKTASLVVCKGRRRIGKSALIQQFGKSFTKFYVFSGLPPTQGVTAETQKDEFAKQLALQFKLPLLQSTDWSDLFYFLATQTKNGRVLLLFDEISWMAQNDGTFLGKLKNAWDLHFSKNPRLILVLCGSISSWIEKNILSTSGFLGRVSLELHLNELPLYICNEFWGAKKERISAHEKFRFLGVTGGVPRYLEELHPQRSAEDNIRFLCFHKEGILFNEFERIFSDLFQRKAPLYKQIVTILAKGALPPEGIFEQLKKQKSGILMEYLGDLVQAGFLSRDYTWKFDGSISKLSNFRLSDNYLRFYLKYIQPNREKITKGDMASVSLANLPNWSSVMALQFENMVLNNRSLIKKRLNISPDEVISDNPYFQRKTKYNKGGCQIDYLIHTRFNTLYLCEIKFSRQPLGMAIIHDIERKIMLLARPKNFSIRPVLIYEGEVSTEVQESNFFDHILSFSELLKM